MFKSFQSNSANECKISALVPLVEESYGIYQFITSMLKAMHAGQPLPLSASFLQLCLNPHPRFSFPSLFALGSIATNDISVFDTLRDRYAQQYGALYQLYQDASSLRYLTSLIAVPKLDPVPLTPLRLPNLLRFSHISYRFPGSASPL